MSNEIENCYFKPNFNDMKPQHILMLIALFLSISLISQNCLPDGFIFYQQAQIDNFQIDYPDCEEIEGDVRIGHDYPTDITNLNGLSVLKAIGGNLDINSHTLLTNLSGLDALESIGGDLIIEENESITSLSGLSSLTSIGGQLDVLENDVLTSLGALTELTEIGGRFRIGHNPLLSSLDGMQNLVSTGTIEFSYVFSLQSLEGLDGLQQINGDLIITTCTGLLEIDALSSLTSVDGVVAIYYNDVLDNLDGFENLSSVTGLLNLTSNGLTSISGLSSLTSIGGELVISLNTQLLSLTGLESLTSIAGVLKIGANHSLTSLDGIQNINSQSITNLEIYNNQLLSACDVKSICDYLGNPGGNIQINTNASGCSSQLEVEEACALGVDDNDYGIVFTIYPNPAFDIINIESIKGIVIEDIRLFNLLGQEIDIKEIEDGKIDISDVENGIYFIELTTKSTTSVSKLIVK